MKKYILTSFIALISLVAHSQISVTYSAGYGMFDLKGANDALSDRALFLQDNLGGSSVTQKYSNSMTHTFGVEYSMGREEYGFEISYMGTRGKIEASGDIMEYQEESNLSALRFGTLFRYHFLQLPIGKKRKVSLYVEISPGVLVTSLKYQKVMRFMIDNEGAYSRDNLGGGSVSFSLLPKLGLRTDIIARLALDVAVGYDLGTAGSIENMNDASINWSGVRGEVGLSYTFK